MSKIAKLIKQPLPCPFCGIKPQIVPWHGGAKTKRLITCEYENCYVQPSVTGSTRANAVARWNGRVSL